MSVRIRLRRVGRKKQPSYRVVIADRAAARDGAYIEAIGFYNPRGEPAQLRLDLERVDYWLGQGAEPSTTVHDLILKARKGGDPKVALVTAQPQPPAAEPPPKRGATARPAAPAEPTGETEAKASPEVGNAAIEGAEPAETMKVPAKPGSRGRGRSAGEATAEGAAEAGPATGGASVDADAPAGTQEIGGADAAQEAAATATTEGATREVAAAEAAAEESEAAEPSPEEEQEKE